MLTEYRSVETTFLRREPRVLPPPFQRPLKGRIFLSAAILHLTLCDWHNFQKTIGEGGIKISVVATNPTNTVACLLFQGTPLNDFSNTPITDRENTQLAMDRART